MKKLIFTIVVLMIFPLTVFSWTDTSGSTDTASVDYDTKDMLNNSYDRGNLKFRVEVDSGSLDNIGDIINIVATSDTVTHNKLDKQYVLISSATDNIDNLIIKTYLLISTGTDALHYQAIKQYILTSTGTDALYYQAIKQYILTSTGTDAVHFEAIKQYLLISSGTDALHFEAVKQYLLISSGTDALHSILSKFFIQNSTACDDLNTAMDEANAEMDRIMVQNSTGTDVLNNSLIKQYVLTSTSTDGLNFLLNKIYLLESTNTADTGEILDKIFMVISTSPVNSGILYDVMRSSAWVQNFPTDYPDSTAQSSLNSIDTTATNIYNQLVSSPIMTVNQDYINKVSTGTAGKLIISGDIVLTIFMDAYSFYSVGGDSQITSTFTDGAMYALEGIPINFQKLSRPISNPTFQCTLATNTTLYYIMNGLK